MVKATHVFKASREAKTLVLVAKKFVRLYGFVVFHHLLLLCIKLYKCVIIEYVHVPKVEVKCI